MRSSKNSFGMLKVGGIEKEIFSYTIENENGMSLEILSYGATIRSLVVPTKEGKVDVVLGCDSVEDYVNNTCYLGATIGRFGNRIGKAEFTLNGKTYTLEKNNGENHLHGGLFGFDKKVWDCELLGRSLVCVYESPDMEEGYPGALTVVATFSLSEDNEVLLTYEVKTTEDTLLNLTNHTYFNLNGAGSILDHILTLHADEILENTNESIPTGRIVKVKGTPYDFTSGKAIGEEIFADYPSIQNDLGYDVHYISNNSSKQLHTLAEVFAPKTGIAMKMETTQVGTQLYTGNFLVGKVKNGVESKKHDGFCLEAQGYPDAIHHENFPSTVLKKGEVYKEQTVYAFSMK
ncbi:MAG: aldose epimerase family protein [Bacillota bacterium]